MKGIRHTALLFTAFLMLGVCTACTSFKRDDPSKVGIFYPDQAILEASFIKDHWFYQEDKLGFSQAVEIKAVGMMTWSRCFGEYQESALISPVLDHLNGDYSVRSNGNYFATIAWLEANGRIEYTGTKSSSRYFWESGWGTFFKLLIGAACIALVVSIIVRYKKEKEAEARKLEYLERERLREIERIEQARLSEIERIKRTKEQVRKANLKEKKEKELKRRKRIVENLSNKLYKETQTEVNKTLIPTLLNELVDVHKDLHSAKMDKLITSGSLPKFEESIDSIKFNLNRLKNLARKAQREKDAREKNKYQSSTENTEKMTYARAFKVLGIPQTATKEEIKKAYRGLVKKYNSDQRANLEEHIKEMLDDKIKEINNAKDYLSSIGLF